MVQIPNCIAWSIYQIIDKYATDVIPQIDEIYGDCICSTTKELVYNHIKSRNEQLHKIREITPILNMYYDKENWMWKDEKYKETLADYKKKIDEFVNWLRSLKGYRFEILNITDWTY